jgi:hypothetical protein
MLADVNPRKGRGIGAEIPAIARALTKDLSASLAK